MCSACEGQPWPWTLLVGASFWTYAESVEGVAWPRLLFFGGHWCGTQCIAQGIAWASRSWHFATGWRLGQKKHKIDFLVFCVSSDPTSATLFFAVWEITNMKVKLPRNFNSTYFIYCTMASLNLSSLTAEIKMALAQGCNLLLSPRMCAAND